MVIWFILTSSNEFFCQINKISVNKIKEVHYFSNSMGNFIRAVSFSLFYVITIKIKIILQKGFEGFFHDFYHLRHYELKSFVLLSNFIGSV